MSDGRASISQPNDNGNIDGTLDVDTVPIDTQSGTINTQTSWKEHWGKTLDVVEGIPKGLQYIQSVDTIVIEKLPKNFIEMINPAVMLPYEVVSAYNIFNKEGTQLYYAFEESTECWIENISPRRRSFVIHLTDRDGVDVCTFRRHLRPLACCCNLCTCLAPCKEKVTVFVQDKDNVKPIGWVIGKIAIIKPRFDIVEPNKNNKFVIKGNRKKTNFNIISGVKTVGKVCPKWAGLAKERFSKDSTSQYGLCFEADETPKVKMIFLASAFFINGRYYEEPPTSKQRKGSA